MSPILPRTRIVTREDLEVALAEIGVNRVRVIEIEVVPLMLVFVRPVYAKRVFELLDERLPAGVGFAVATLGFFENLFRRKTYHVV